MKKRNFLLIGMIAALRCSAVEAQEQKIAFTSLNVAFPTALASQENEWLKNCQFVQGHKSPLQLTCLWQQEYVDLFHSKWRQWSVNFDQTGRIQSRYVSIQPSSDQNKISSGVIVAFLSDQTTLVYTPQPAYNSSTGSWDIDAYDLEVITDLENPTSKRYGSLKNEPVDALALPIGYTLVLSHQYAEAYPEETPIERRIDFDPYVLQMVDSAGHIYWQFKEEYIQKLWQKQVGHISSSNSTVFIPEKPEFLVGADQQNVVVAGIRSWPVQDGQKTKLEIGAFIACYSINGTSFGVLGTYLGTILLPNASSFISADTVKLVPHQAQIVGAWLASDQQATAKDELIVNHWMQNCDTNKDSRPAWHIAIPNPFKDWKDGVNSYIKAIQPAANGHLYVLYIQQRAQSVCLKWKDKECKDQAVFKKNPELLRPALFLMEIDGQGQVVANQAIIGVDDPKGWVLVYLEDIEDALYADQHIQFFIEAKMALTNDQQHLVVLIRNPSAVSSTIRQSYKKLQAQLLLYQVQIQP